MPLPTIGPRQAGEVRISPRLRRRLARRTYSLARREYLPALQADRAALRSVKKARRRDVQSAYGATKLATRSIKAAQNQLGSSGLSGIFRQEAGQELSAQRGDVAAGTPGVIAGVRQQYQSPISQARGAIIGDRATIAKEAASGFASELSKARTQGRSFLTHQRSTRGAQAKKGKAHKRNVEQRAQQAHQDFRVGVNLLVTYGAKGFPTTPQEWARFGQYLGTQLGGTNPHSRALRVVKEMRRPKVYQPLLTHLILASQG